MLKPDPADPLGVLLGCHCNEGFMSGLPANDSLLQASEVRLVHLDCPRKTIPARANHRSTQLVKPRPRCQITAEPQDALKAKRARSVFLACDVPHCVEPKPKRLTSTLKDGPSRHGRLVVAPCAFKPMRISQSSSPFSIMWAVPQNSAFCWTRTGRTQW